MEKQEKANLTKYHFRNNPIDQNSQTNRIIWHAYSIQEYYARDLYKKSSKKHPQSTKEKESSSSSSWKLSQINQ